MTYDKKQKDTMLLDIFKTKIEDNNLPYNEGVIILVKHTIGGTAEQTVNVYTPESFKRYKEFGRQNIKNSAKICTCSFCAVHSNTQQELCTCPTCMSQD